MTAEQEIGRSLGTRNWNECAIDLYEKPKKLYFARVVTSNGLELFSTIELDQFGLAQEMKIPLSKDPVAYPYPDSVRKISEIIRTRTNLLAQHNLLLIGGIKSASETCQTIGATWNDRRAYNEISNAMDLTPTERHLSVSNAGINLPMSTFLHKIGVSNIWRIDPATLEEIQNLPKTDLWKDSTLNGLRHPKVYLCKIETNNNKFVYGYIEEEGQKLSIPFLQEYKYNFSVHNSRDNELYKNLFSFEQKSASFNLKQLGLTEGLIDKSILYEKLGTRESKAANDLIGPIDNTSSAGLYSEGQRDFYLSVTDRSFDERIHNFGHVINSIEKSLGWKINPVNKDELNKLIQV